MLVHAQCNESFKREDTHVLINRSDYLDAKLAFMVQCYGHKLR